MGETNEGKPVELASTGAESANDTHTAAAGRESRFSFISLRVKVLVGFT